MNTWSPVKLTLSLFGTIIGAGWIVASGDWITQAGPVGAMLAFVVGGLIMMVIGLCFVEAAATFPDAAGSVAFTFRACGSRLAFYCGWFIVISYIATIAFFIVASVDLLHSIAPSVSNYHISVFGFSVKASILYVGLILTLGMTILGILGLETASSVQILLVSLLTFIAIFLAAIALFEGDSQLLIPAFTGNGSISNIKGIAAVAATTPFWFSGLDIIMQVVQGKVSKKDLKSWGKVVFYSTALAFVFYGIIIFSVASLIPRGGIEESAVPTVDAFANQTGGFDLSLLVVLGGLAGVLSTWIVCLIASARILTTMANARMMPTTFSSTTRQSSRFALVSISTLSLLLAIAGGQTLDTVLTAASISILLAFIIVCYSVLQLRISEPSLYRPFMAGKSLALPISAILFSVLLVIVSITEPFIYENDIPIALWLMFAWVALGVVYWRLIRARVASMAPEKIRAKLFKI